MLGSFCEHFFHFFDEESIRIDSMKNHEQKQRNNMNTCVPQEGRTCNRATPAQSKRSLLFWDLYWKILNILWFYLRFHIFWSPFCFTLDVILSFFFISCSSLRKNQKIGLVSEPRRVPWRNRKGEGGTWRSHHGGVFMEESSWRRHPP